MTLMTLQVVGTVVLCMVIISLVNATTWWTPGASHAPGLGGIRMGRNGAWGEEGVTQGRKKELGSHLNGDMCCVSITHAEVY